MRWSVLRNFSFAVFLLPSIAQATVSIVQQQSAIDAGTSTISATITGTTSGNSLIFTIQGAGGLTFSGLAVSGETLVCGVEQDSSANQHTQLCYIKSLGSSGSKTITDSNLHLSWAVQMFELSGADTTTFTDGTGGGTGTSASTFTVTVTPATSGDAIFAIFTNDNVAGTPTVSGYTAGANNNQGSRANLTFYKLTTSSGTNNILCDNNASNAVWAGNAQAVLASGGPPPSSSVRHRVVQ